MDPIDRLCEGISLGRIDIFEKFLPLISDLNIKGSRGEWPLFTAFGRDIEYTKLLLDAGARPDMHSSSEMQRPHMEHVKLLVNAGADINRSNLICQTLSIGKPEDLEYLLNHGGNLIHNLFDVEYETDFGFMYDIKLKSIALFTKQFNVDMTEIIAKQNIPWNHTLKNGNSILCEFIQNSKFQTKILGRLFSAIEIEKIPAKKDGVFITEEYQKLKNNSKSALETIVIFGGNLKNTAYESMKSPRLKLALREKNEDQARKAIMNGDSISDYKDEIDELLYSRLKSLEGTMHAKSIVDELLILKSNRYESKI